MLLGILDASLFENLLTGKGTIRAIYDSITHGYFCVGFIDFMLKVQSLLDYKNLFSPSEYGKNDKIILKHFR